MSPRQRTPDRKTVLKASICVACDESWLSRGRTKSPMPLCWRKQALLACISCFANADCTGSETSVEWRTVVYPRISCMVCLLQNVESKSDLNLTGIETDKWEPLAADRNGWRHAVNSGVKSGERMRILRLEEKREQRKAKQQNVEVNPPLEFVCNRCGRDCHARIGLLSHSKRCSRHVQQD